MTQESTESAQPRKSWLDVAAAVITDPLGRILLTRRREGKDFSGMWEFPGGKVEAGESPAVALARELHEELGIDTDAAQDMEPLITVPHHYKHKSIRLIMFRVTSQMAPRAQEGQAMTWVYPEQLRRYHMPAADRPVCAALLDSPWYWSHPVDIDPDALLSQVQHAQSSGYTRFWLRALFASRVDEVVPAAWRAAVTQAARWLRSQGAEVWISRDRSLAQSLQAGCHLSSHQLRELDTAQKLPIPLAASCHDAESLLLAERAECQFVTLSPVLGHPKYADGRALGWEGFEALRASTALPIYALGGLNPSHLMPSRAVGAQGIAAVRGFQQGGHLVP